MSRFLFEVYLATAAVNLATFEAWTYKRFRKMVLVTFGWPIVVLCGAAAACGFKWSVALLTYLGGGGQEPPTRP